MLTLHLRKWILKEALENSITVKCERIQKARRLVSVLRCFAVLASPKRGYLQASTAAFHPCLLVEARWRLKSTDTACWWINESLCVCASGRKFIYTF